MDVTAVIDSDIAFGGDTRARISSQGGGAAANVATWLAYLGEDVFLVSRVGDDFNGAALHAELDLYKVNHSDKRVPGEKSGTVIVLVTADGERTMFPDSASNSGLSQEDLPQLDGFTAAYISGYALINPQSRTNVQTMIGTLKSSGMKVILDPGTVGALRNVPFSCIHEWIGLADILILNEEEALFIAQESDIERALITLAQSSPLVVVKRGSRGAIAIYDTVIISDIPTTPVNVIDTTGAGDSFAAGFISEWFQSATLEAAIVRGAQQARICIESVGARPPIGKAK
ncbi:MAG: hypothetical protein RL414_513 [Actinomycetota bacterium]